jgi:hypothetical protein
VSVTRHQLVLGTATLNYTATAGHLTALAPVTNAPEASFFYVAYTLDGANAATRPVTFFYNGGPGSATVWLHLGSFGPKRLAASAPSTTAPTPFPLVDNAQSLIDVSDLVFVDAIGSGFSEAIAPNLNRTFWGVDADAAVFRDFARSATPPPTIARPRPSSLRRILRDRAQRQSSAAPRERGRPAEGRRAAVVGAQLQRELRAFHSARRAAASCYRPTGRWRLFQPATGRGGKSLPDYEAQLRPFAATQYTPRCATTSPMACRPTARSSRSSSRRPACTPLSRWQSNFNLDPTTFHNVLIPGTVLGMYDARVTAPGRTPLAAESDPSSTFITPSFTSAITQYLSTDLGYTAPSSYVVSSNAINQWNFSTTAPPFRTRFPISRRHRLDPEAEGPLVERPTTTSSRPSS